MTDCEMKGLDEEAAMIGLISSDRHAEPIISDDPTVSVKSMEGGYALVFIVDRDCAMSHSQLIHNSLENDNEATELQLGKAEHPVGDEFLKVFVDFLKHHKDQAPVKVLRPLRSTDPEHIFKNDKWYVDFFNSHAMKDEEDPDYDDHRISTLKRLFMLAKAANFLSMDLDAGLMPLIATCIVVHTKGKKKWEIGAFYNLRKAGGEAVPNL